MWKSFSALRSCIYISPTTPLGGHRFHTNHLDLVHKTVYRTKPNLLTRIWWNLVWMYCGNEDLIRCHHDQCHPMSKCCKPNHPCGHNFKSQNYWSKFDETLGEYALISGELIRFCIMWPNIRGHQGQIGEIFSVGSKVTFIMDKDISFKCGMGLDQVIWVYSVWGRHREYLGD